MCVFSWIEYIYTYNNLYVYGIMCAFSWIEYIYTYLNNLYVYGLM
jgi:hypothetical protein